MYEIQNKYYYYYNCVKLLQNIFRIESPFEGEHSASSTPLLFLPGGRGYPHPFLTGGVTPSWPSWGTSKWEMWVPPLDMEVAPLPPSGDGVPPLGNGGTHPPLVPSHTDRRVSKHTIPDSFGMRMVKTQNSSTYSLFPLTWQRVEFLCYSSSWRSQSHYLTPQCRTSRRPQYRHLLSPALKSNPRSWLVHADSRITRGTLFRTTCCGQLTVADLRGRKGRAPPPLAKNVFIFMHFLGKIGQIIGWRPPLGLAPSPLGNPGSATV